MNFMWILIVMISSNVRLHLKCQACEARCTLFVISTTIAWPFPTLSAQDHFTSSWSDSPHTINQETAGWSQSIFHLLNVSLWHVLPSHHAV